MSAKQEPKNGNFYTICGAVVTVLWLGGLIAYGSLNVAGIKLLAPNELGDALAGAFAPLAFLWLVLGYFQQGVELRNSGEALRLQGEELRNSVEQQRELVSVSREQLHSDSEARQLERDERHRNAQPILIVRAGGWSKIGDVYQHMINISNHGKGCTGVVVSIGSSSSTINYDKLSSGDTITINKGFKSGEDEKLSMFIKYTDELLRDGLIEYYINWIDDKIDIVKCG